MNKALELLSTIITSDFPEENLELQNKLCFCASELLTELQKKTVCNFLSHIAPYNATDLFTVCVYAVYEDGHTGKYNSLVPIMSGQVPGWTFNLLDEYRETTNSNVEAFAIYLVRPSKVTKPCVRLIIYKK